MKLISLLTTLAFFFSSSSVFAEKIIGNLNFSQGEWTLVGVPMHNYKKLPIQEELGSFISKDVELMKDIQQKWDLEMTFDDKCDYHYALKFYNGKELVSTITLNLYCGYITANGMSYEFDPNEFERFKTNATSVPWSRISFKDMDQLKKAIRVLSNTPEVYWYDDMNPYNFEGYFMLTINNAHWNANLDSLEQEVSTKLASIVGENNYYLKQYYFLMQGDKMMVKYFIHCNEGEAKSLQVATKSYMNWRSHLYQSEVSIVAIGVSEKRYWNLMNP